VAAGFQYSRGDNYAHTDMHCLDLDSFTWSPVIMDAQCPVALQGHRAVVAGDSMFIVGGKVRDEHLVGPDGHCSGLNDSVYRYRFDVNRWSKLETNGTRPPPRQLHAAVTIPRDENVVSIFVCGGADKSRHAYFNDMWELRDIRVPHRVSSDCNHCQMTGSMVNNPKFSDVTFIVEGQRVYAHRFILFSRCDYFRCMFEAGMKESTADEINVPGIKHKVFLAVMQFIYTGNVTMPEGSLAVGLLQAADMFGLDALRGQCVAKIESALTVENAAYVCQVADTHNASHLKQYCISFILHNFRGVIETDAWSSLNAAELGREILRAYASCCTFDPGAFRKRARVR
jgi:leucine-zipper-like transcriptional regulator 1